MTSKLALYNAANLILGERKLASLTENRPSRRRLDSWWDGGGVKACLQAGLWNHAMNTVSLTFSPSIDPGEFFQYAFDKPTGWVRTALVSDDPQFCNKRFQYEDQGAYWYANTDTIYARFVSDDTAFGMDLSLWPENFTRFVEYDAAERICVATTNSNANKEQISKDRKKWLNTARATDAMDESPKFLPAGTWSTARRFGGRSGGDGGNTGSLIG